jgi:hypothetical protein
MQSPVAQAALISHTSLFCCALKSSCSSATQLAQQPGPLLTTSNTSCDRDACLYAPEGFYMPKSLITVFTSLSPRPEQLRTILSPPCSMHTPGAGEGSQHPMCFWQQGMCILR